MTEKSIEKQIHELNHSVYSLGAELTKLEHVNFVLNRISIEALEMKGTEKEKYFLWDNNDPLQMVEDYLHRVSDTIEEYQKEVERIAGNLFDVVVKGEGIEK